MDEALQEAIKAAGGVRALGRMLGTSHTAIMRWEKVPAARVVEVERFTGVPRERLRPDLYRQEEFFAPADEDGPMVAQMLTRSDLAEYLTPESPPVKPEILRRAVEKATDRALRQFAKANPELIAEQWRQSVQRRLVGMLYEELMRALGRR
jgi:hypothetical protein